MNNRFNANIKHEITIEDLLQHKWYGNILELESVVNQLAIDGLESEMITREAFFKKINKTFCL